MSNPPPRRRWLSRFSPFRWFEAWVERMECRQKDLLIQSETLRLQIAASRAQAAELRAEVERLQAEASELLGERASTLPLPTPPLPRASAPSARRRCPRGHAVPVAARFCPECGHVFPTRSSGGG